MYPKQAIVCNRTLPLIGAVIIWLLAINSSGSALSNGHQKPNSTSFSDGLGQADKSQPQPVKCSRQSIMLTRQMLMNELEAINSYNAIWFNDLDKDELIREQRDSLGNLILSPEIAGQLLTSGQNGPMFEIEASYLRVLNRGQPISSERNILPKNGAGKGEQQQQALSIRLMRRNHHQLDRCYLNAEKNQYVYVVGLSIGPIEHHLDVVYNLPKELRLSQPIGWKYAQVSLSVPKMNYEVVFKQVANYSLNYAAGCPMKVAEITHLNAAQAKAQTIIVVDGLAANNQTIAQLNSLFDDYTRPTIWNRLRQVLRFHLSSKTFPLSTN